MARAREGKDGRPPRLDPVLDEVAAKLEKEVFELQAGQWVDIIDHWSIIDHFA